MNTRKLLLVPPLLLVGASFASCISTVETTGTGKSAESCPEFQPGASFATSVPVDARVHAFVQASADLGGVAATLKSAVKTACVGIASDLAANDSWSPLGDTDEAISNSNGNGACDVARAQVVTIMNAHPNANFALVVSRGECHTDFATEAQCEEGCASQQKCDPGTVETRCDPAQLSVVCDGNCAAQAFCEGHVDAETNCEGQCEAECTGHCSGSCTDESGRKTDNDVNCHGKCNDHCSGTCNGRCKVDVSTGVQCGSNISCKGGCMGNATAPECETECTPPNCTIDQSCFESCRASVSAKAVCEPPTVKLLADASAGNDVAMLMATIDKNLPPLIQSAEAQGRIFVDEVQNLATSGKAVLSAAGDLDFKSLGCATVAAQSLTKTTATLQVATQAGAGVTSDCSSHAN